MLSGMNSRGLLLFLVLLLTGVTAWAQGIRIDSVSAGPVAVHDHVRFDFHIRVQNDPYPHEFKEDYAYDGADVKLRVGWHWGETPLATSIQFSPAARSHFAFDQDTDFEPGTNSTHGDAGMARSRTLMIGQEIPLGSLAHLGRLAWNESFLMQRTRYGLVTTYDLNSNPSLPSSSYQRTIPEQANVYELRSTLELARTLDRHGWQAGVIGGATPVSQILLHNYVPNLEATSTEAYGFSSRVFVGSRIGGMGWMLGGNAGWYNSYHSIKGFRREVFSMDLEITPWRR